ncbi:class I SAM-dependent methyltransferase family protein [Candidatus Woesearchaeota archaeon]|nr:class I SAM-dependent methyltransferase family protein [Candidatus Woesearchaeota archaeon]
MLAIGCNIKDAEKVKKYLIKNHLFNYDYGVKKAGRKIYFPVIRRFRSKELDIRFVDIDLDIRQKKLVFKDFLFENLNSQELGSLVTSFDVIGDIAILEIPGELVPKEKMIAEALLLSHKNIRTVLKKAGSHEGTFRTQKMKYLAGERKKETVHKEYGCCFMLDVEKVYFSPRLGNERKIIAKMVKKGESVLVMFSGCAPYPIVLSRNTKAGDIVGIEINPAGHDYALKNIALNKAKNVKVINGDVKHIVPKLDQRFDRIIMPLPKSAGDFLDVALSASKEGTIIHFYDFLEDKDIPQRSHDKILKACTKAGLECRFLGFRKCGQHSPRTYRVCVDFQVTKHKTR